MQRISWKQTKAVLASLDVLYSEPEPATLPARILGALKAAVASETILVDGFGHSDHMESLAQHPVGHMTPHDYSTLARYLPQHPLFPLIILAGRTGPLRTAEVASAQRFSRTALYDEMFRPMSISDQMIMRVNGQQGTFITCCLNRVRKEFSEGERRALGLIGSHLASAVTSARALERMREVESYLQHPFGWALRGIAVLGAGGEIKYATDSATALIQKYFRRGDNRPGRLPDTLSHWLRQPGASWPGADFHPPRAAPDGAGGGRGFESQPVTQPRRRANPAPGRDAHARARHAQGARVDGARGGSLVLGGAGQVGLRHSRPVRH